MVRAASGLLVCALVASPFDARELSAATPAPRFSTDVFDRPRFSTDILPPPAEVIPVPKPQLRQLPRQIVQPPKPAKRAVDPRTIARGRHWTVVRFGRQVSGRANVIQHLLNDGIHRGRYSLYYLQSLSLEQLLSIHDADHEGR